MNCNIHCVVKKIIRLFNRFSISVSVINSIGMLF